MSTADGNVIGTVKIVDHGPAERKLNMVLVAEGYRQNELTKFENDAREFVDYLFSTVPFNEFKCAFNIYRIDVTSTDSGADDPGTCTGGTGYTAATYFDASFCNNGIRRLLEANTLLAQSVVESEIPQWHQIIIMVNSSIYGGSGGSVMVFAAGHPDWKDVAVHELGHAMFGLADEYNTYYGCTSSDTTHDTYIGTEPIQANITTNADAATIKWKELLTPGIPVPTTSNPDCGECDAQPNPFSEDTVGAYEGGGYYHCGIYRPQYSCKMYYGGAFCEVCAQEIRKSLAPFTTSKCLAPVFGPSGALQCFIKFLLYGVIVIALAFFAWVPSILCVIKKFVFRIRYCRNGNDNPCIEL